MTAPKDQPGDDDITDVYDWDAASWRRLRSQLFVVLDRPELGQGAEEPDWDHEDWAGEPIDVPEFDGENSGIRYLPEKKA